MHHTDYRQYTHTPRERVLSTTMYSFPGTTVQVPRQATEGVRVALILSGTPDLRISLPHAKPGFENKLNGQPFDDLFLGPGMQRKKNAPKSAINTSVVAIRAVSCN